MTYDYTHTHKLHVSCVNMAIYYSYISLSVIQTPNLQDYEDGEVHKSSCVLTQHFVCWREETSKRFVGWWEKSAAIFPRLALPRHHHCNCVKQHSLGEVSVCLGHGAAPERAIKCSSTELVLFE